MSAVPMSTQEQLVRVGERLFAQHGLDGVSLRQIGVAAGNANNSAVQYHFGSKDQLVRAIFEYRLPRLHARRALLIEQAPPGDLRAWVECQARSVLEQGELDDSHYAGFLTVLHHYGRSDVFEPLPEPFAGNSRAYFDHLRSLLPHLPEPLRGHRVSRAMNLVVHTAADRERRRAAGAPLLPFAIEVESVVDGLVGFLEAPASARSLATLDDVAHAEPAWPLGV
ncbi:TetR/AcrR family transcriptional regulator [Trujillonella endophytica]|nr:TetR/AcrR family transcriptional regulator [Trujillella endophytica]